ncbi:MAG: hypothetical protein EOR57_31345 [Mesorhizobium sp.]|uniref:hypothetical protein n=1 Tax=Mesorhizobium sp. TaxID=1871066 RepID=UPI000FE4FAA3|nr:hypothetical protein [Mesorhizobium sp.]RWL14842.1 MAG: hypothetical protein EOR57_31345 [Mesorhizobium sp.]
MNAFTRSASSMAREAGYTGNSPAMLNAFEQIRLAGIREARAGHYERKRIIDGMKAEPRMFFNAISPAQSSSEAIEDATRIIFTFRNLPRWQQEMSLGQLRKAKMTRLVARFFRRYGVRIWAREIAA